MSRRYSLFISLVILVPIVVLLLIGAFTPALKSALGVTFGWLSAGLFSGGYSQPAYFPLASIQPDSF